jgi:23S rRNA (uracil1939-C5)-methyltransferase
MAAQKDVPCIHWKDCGGCPLIRFDYKEQLKKKSDRIVKAYLEQGFPQELIKKILKPTKASPKTLGYRNKAKWILEEDPKKGLLMGIYSPGTHDVVDIPHCAVHASPINEVSAFIKTELIKGKVRCGHDISDGIPKLRYLIVRYSFREKKLITVFVTTSNQVAGLDVVFKNLAAEFGDRVVAIVQNINADSGNVLLGEANKFIRKTGELTEMFGRFRVPVGPLSFLQVNSFQASHLYKRARELIGGGPFEAGLDLYSGVGLFALHMASVTKRILAVEEVGPAALEAMTASRRNRAKNILQLCSDAHEGISTFVGEWGSPDWVVINPPRKGCDEGVLQALASKAPRKLVYISCNPVTQARDVAILMREHPDFELKTLEPVDMFPQTEHVECIVLLENKNFVKSSAGASQANPSSSKKFH